MGDWYESCSLTNLPITHGDEVVVVIPKEGVEPFLHEEFAERSARTKIDRIIRGHYDGYGRLEEHPDWENPGYNVWTLWFRADAWDSVQRVYHEELKQGEWYRKDLERQDEVEAYILEHQADKDVVTRQMLDEFKKPKLSIEDSMAIVAIVWFANTTRLSLGYKAPLGEHDEMKNHRLLVAMMQRGIDKITAEQESWRDPEDVEAGEYDDYDKDYEETIRMTGQKPVVVDEDDEGNAGVVRDMRRSRIDSLGV